MNNLLKRIQELNNDLIIREATRADVSGLTLLMHKHYARKNNEKYFLWRFFSCPAPSVLYIITTKENVIIGAYGINVFTLTNGKRCGLTVDLIISSAYTHRGLLFLLENKIEEFAKKHHCSYLLCLPNTIGMKAHTKIEGWRMVKAIPVLVLDPNKVTAKKYHTSDIPDKKNISFEYNKALLYWRFIKNPEYKYSHIKLGKCQSYIKIFTDTTKDISIGDIVYYDSPFDSKLAFSTLITKSVKKLHQMNAQKIITWCNKNSPFYSIFISLGFTSDSQWRYLCIKPLLVKVTNPKLLDWYILPADSEVF